MLATHHREHYDRETLSMGNTTLKGSAITRWQARNQIKQAVTSHNDRLLAALLRIHGSACQNVRVNKNGDTPFMLAVRSHYHDGLSILLRHNAANPNLTNAHGSSALDIALLASSISTNHMDEDLVLLSRITRNISLDVLTNVLDPEYQSLERTIKTAALIVGNSTQYEVRAKVIFTLLKFYPKSIALILTDFGVDPTGITDWRIDFKKLWFEVRELCYFKKPILQIIPQDIILLLIRAANGEDAIDTLLDLIMTNIQPKEPTSERAFHQEALQLLAIAGCRFSPDALAIISSYIPEVLLWYQTHFAREVPSLMSVSRQRIRESMASNVIYGSKQLGLPRSLQSYLCLN